MIERIDSYFGTYFKRGNELIGSIKNGKVVLCKPNLPDRRWLDINTKTFKRMMGLIYTDLRVFDFLLNEEKFHSCARCDMKTCNDGHRNSRMRWIEYSFKDDILK